LIILTGARQSQRTEAKRTNPRGAQHAKEFTRSEFPFARRERV
jgi:hypothetical protein